MNDDFRRALDDIKLRLPIEEVVGWSVPGLKRQGALWVACCPFHEENTPSFKVDPRRGTWRCYGACGEGGDQISFVERAHRVEFLEALEILAQRAGVALPDKRSQDRRQREDENQPLYDVLTRAERFFQKRLGTSAGREALEYLRARGLQDETLRSFGVGYAVGSGADGLLSTALNQGVSLKTLVSAGLARAGSEEHGDRPRDFFYSRLTIPVHDLKGRTVGFGARRLNDESGGPKYVNTPETVLFHKGRLIYGLHKAIDTVRRQGHLVLVEGYTDVMAAHQVGLTQVVAVLGTATTDEHAALVRRSGARRVSLVFDGDEAGRRATQRALHGLLPLDVQIDVLRLPGGQDPCDLLVREGAEAFEQALAGAEGWFEHECARIAELDGAARLQAIDGLLELVLRLSKPLAREQRLSELAHSLDLPAQAVRDQLESLPARRRELLLRRRAPELEPAHEGDESAGAQGSGDAPRDEHLYRAWRALIGSLLLEPALSTSSDEWRDRCPFEDLAPLLEAVLDVDRSGVDAAEDARVRAVLTALGESPARHHVVPLLEEAAQADEAAALYADARRTLEEHALAADAEAQLRALQAAGDDAQREREVMAQLHETLRQQKIEQRETSDRDAPATRAEANA